jgi:hypothetical protein
LQPIQTQQHAVARLQHRKRQARLLQGLRRQNQIGTIHKRAGWPLAVPWMGWPQRMHPNTVVRFAVQTRKA